MAIFRRGINLEGCLFMTFNNKRDVILVCARLFYWSMRRSFPVYAYDPLTAMLE